MKKVITALFALIAMLVFVSFASAATYVVKKGDNLIKIARKYPGVSWQQIWKENLKLVKKPDYIQTGWRLRISEKNVGVVETASSRSELFYWNSPGADPVMNYFNHDDEKCIKKIIKTVNNSPLSAVQKERLTKAIKEKARRALRDEDFGKIKSGDKFPWMAIHKGQRFKKKVIANWKDGKEFAAVKYRIKISGREEVYFVPLKCGNLCPAPVVARKQKVIATPIMAKKQKKMLPLLLRRQITLSSKPRAALSKPSKPLIAFYPDWEAWAYAGIYQGVQDGNSHDWSCYYGGNISFFPGQAKIGEGVLRAGPALQYVGWQGEAGQAVDYSGNMILWGGEAQYFTGSTKSQFKIYSGTKRGEVYGQGFPYEAREKAKIIAVEPAFQWWYGGRKWFNEMEVGSRMEFASSETKDAYWDGNPIPKADDPVNDQSYYSLRAKTEIYQGKYVIPTVELATGYRAFDKSLHLEPRAGVKFWRDLAETDISYNLIEHNQNDMAGVHLMVNVSYGTKMLVKWLWGIIGQKADATTPTPFDLDTEDYIMGPSIGGGGMSM